MAESGLVTKQDLKLAVSELKVSVTFMLLAQVALVVTLQNHFGG
jgi:hypothetical protein